MPLNNNPDKNAAIRDFGAELVEVGDDYSATVVGAERAVAETGMVFVHSFTNPAVVAGAATVRWRCSSNSRISKRSCSRWAAVPMPWAPSWLRGR